MFRWDVMSTEGLTIAECSIGWAMFKNGVVTYGMWASNNDAHNRIMEGICS